MRKFKKPETRKAKIEFIKDLMTGRTSMKDILKPISAFIVSQEGKIVIYQTEKERRVFDPPIPKEDFKQAYTHDVQLCDFSKK